MCGFVTSNSGLIPFVQQVLTKKSHDLYTGGKQNKGLEERAKRDEQQLKEEEDGKSWDGVQEKLRQKSELYDKMGKNNYCVQEISVICYVIIGVLYLYFLQVSKHA